MMDGITFRASPLMPKGSFALERGGQVAGFGRITHLSEQYRLGDIVIVSEDDYYGLVAGFAKDVTTFSALEDRS